MAEFERGSTKELTPRAMDEYVIEVAASVLVIGNLRHGAIAATER